MPGSPASWRLAFLDADDLFAPEKLARESALLEGAEAAMLYGPTRWTYENSSKRDRVEWLGVPAGRVYPPPELLRRILLLQEGRIPCTCGVLIRREAALSVGGFEKGFRLYEDQSLWAKVFLRFPAYISSQCHARYRQHEASSSSAAERAGEYHPTRPHPAGLAFLEWLQGCSSVRPRRTRAHAGVPVGALSVSASMAGPRVPGGASLPVWRPPAIQPERLRFLPPRTG